MRTKRLRIGKIYIYWLSEKDINLGFGDHRRYFNFSKSVYLFAFQVYKFQFLYWR